MVIIRVTIPAYLLTIAAKAIACGKQVTAKDNSKMEC